MGHGRMLFTRCSSSCGCGDLCTNLPFQKLPGCKLKVVQVKFTTFFEFLDRSFASLEPCHDLIAGSDGEWINIVVNCTLQCRQTGVDGG